MAKCAACHLMSRNHLYCLYFVLRGGGCGVIIARSAHSGFWIPLMDLPCSRTRFLLANHVLND
jgi:hypothetical protein